MVRNERLKLLANALDRASTAVFAVGVFGPVVGGSPGPGSVVATVLPWIVAGLAPHGAAQLVPGTLRA